MTETVTYNDIADLLAECRRPDYPDGESWPNPDNFLQRQYAADAGGRPVRPEDPAAARWCPVGRIENIAYVDPDSGAPGYDENVVNVALHELYAAMQQVDPIPVISDAMAWTDRDGRGTEQVAAAFDLAIANCRRKGTRPAH